MSNSGRQLKIGPTDNTSDQRTPRNRLRLIPEIAREIGADHLIYQEVEDLKAAIIEGSEVTELDMSCFTGEYVTGSVDSEYLDWVENNQAS